MLRTISAGGVVVNPEGKILVVNQNGTSWSLPKGHVEAGEDLLSAARREICEEAGISELIFEKELGSYERSKIGSDGGEDRSETKTIHMFLFRTGQMELKPQDPRNPEARWVAKKEVAKLLSHPLDRQFFERIRDVI